MAHLLFLSLCAHSLVVKWPLWSVIILHTVVCAKGKNMIFLLLAIWYSQGPRCNARENKFSLAVLLQKLKTVRRQRKDHFYWKRSIKYICCKKCSVTILSSRIIICSAKKEMRSREIRNKRTYNKQKVWN